MAEEQAEVRRVALRARRRLRPQRHQLGHPQGGLGQGLVRGVRALVPVAHVELHPCDGGLEEARQAGGGPARRLFAVPLVARDVEDLLEFLDIGPVDHLAAEVVGRERGGIARDEEQDGHERDVPAGQGRVVGAQLEAAVLGPGEPGRRADHDVDAGVVEGRHVDRAQGRHAAAGRVAGAEVAVEGEVQRAVGAVVLGVDEGRHACAGHPDRVGRLAVVVDAVRPRLAEEQVFGVDVGAAGRRARGQQRRDGLLVAVAGEGGAEVADEQVEVGPRRAADHLDRHVGAAGDRDGVEALAGDLERVGRDGRLLCRLDARLAARRPEDRDDDAHAGVGCRDLARRLEEGPAAVDDADDVGADGVGHDARVVGGDDVVEGPLVELGGAVGHARERLEGVVGPVEEAHLAIGLGVGLARDDDLASGRAPRSSRGARACAGRRCRCAPAAR